MKRTTTSNASTVSTDRRRKIITDSDDDIMHPRSNAGNGTQFAAVMDGVAVVVIETSHDESDESQVSPRHSHHQQGADQSPLHTYSMQQMTTQQNVHRQPPRTRTERNAALDNSASSNRQLQPSQHNTGSMRRQIISAAEAEESHPPTTMPNTARETEYGGTTSSGSTGSSDGSLSDDFIDKRETEFTPLQQKTLMRFFPIMMKNMIEGSHDSVFRM